MKSIRESDTDMQEQNMPLNCSAIEVVYLIVSPHTSSEPQPVESHPLLTMCPESASECAIGESKRGSERRVCRHTYPNARLPGEASS